MPQQLQGSTSALGVQHACSEQRLCTIVCLQALQSVASAFLETEELPTELRPAIVEHMMMVHQSVRQFSTRFAEELRRHNYVTVSDCAGFGLVCGATCKQGRQHLPCFADCTCQQVEMLCKGSPSMTIP